MKTVCVTGGAGRIAYALIPSLCDGSVFGSDQIHLNLLDVPMEGCVAKLSGVKMEIEDCCYEHVLSVQTTTDPKVAFEGANVVIILGGYPRTPGMERKELITINAEGMRVQAEALNNYASRDCKVLVIANPCNTNCLVAMTIAKNIPPQNFSCLTRLDQERLTSFVTRKVNTMEPRLAPQPLTARNVRYPAIWGNHSSTQVPDVTNLQVSLSNDDNWVPLSSVVDSAWVHQDLIPKVQNRGAEVMNMQKASSGLSAANAIAQHLRDWLSSDASAHSPHHTFSMGIRSDGNPYGIPPGLIFSFPCRHNSAVAGGIEIVPGLQVDAAMRAMLDATVAELVQERDNAETIVGALH